MNAAVLAQGWSRGGREGARRCSTSSGVASAGWRSLAVAALGVRPRHRQLDIDRSPVTYVDDLVQHALSPYAANPMGFNPLRDLLRELVDGAMCKLRAAQTVHHRHQCAKPASRGCSSATI